MDERIMHLFSIIAGEVQHRQDLFTNEGKIMDALLNKGVHLMEADTALTLMQSLAERQTEQIFEPETAPFSTAMRTMNTEERSRFTLEAFSFISKLFHLGLIAESEREELIEQALGGQGGRVGLDQVKTMVALLFFTEGREYDEEKVHPSSLGRIRNTAWN